MKKRHKKFSSIGRNLSSEIQAGKTYKTNRNITSIAVHCSFSPQGRGDDAKTIDTWHKKRWGTGIGYHYVVLEDGTIQKGRWVDYKGAHTKGHNKKSIGICRIGGMRKDGTAKEDVTREQMRSLRVLTHLLIDMYDLKLSDIKGHNEYPKVNKSCPLMNMNMLRDFKH